MLKLMSVVGARPNFMKIAPIVEEIRRFPDIEHCLVHSGQHYDRLLSDTFFADLNLPQPDVNLQVGSSSHAMQTAEIMKRLEPVLLEYKPRLVIVVGDVNSTIASALTCVKLGIPVAHVEAGLRSFDLTMPEEINRKLTDAISELLFVTEKSGLENLQREGVPDDKVFFVGNVMIDSLLRYRALAAKSRILDQLGLRRNGLTCLDYGILTLHRPSNVDDPKTLRGILDAVAFLTSEFPVLFPVHPRTRSNIEGFGLAQYLANSGTTSGIVPLEPLGYLDFLALTERARIVLTDSGGIQEETTVLGVPCLTLRKNTERPATVEHGTNHVVGTEPDAIVLAAQTALQQPARQTRRPPLWDGKTAERIVGIVRQHFEQGVLALWEKHA